MSNFRRLLKKHKVDSEDFDEFYKQVKKPKNEDPRKRLFDTYDRSLQRIEIFRARLEVWILVNVDKADFEKRYEMKGKRLQELERVSVAKLEHIFEVYKRSKRP